VWEVLVEAEIHRALDLGEHVDEDAFDAMVLHVDGYLCALKDAQIRGGLHVLGRGPDGEALVDLVLAVTRSPQGPVRSLRAVVAERWGIDPATERRGGGAAPGAAPPGRGGARRPARAARPP